jgi:hypothetical protein
MDKLLLIDGDDVADRWWWELEDAAYLLNQSQELVLFHQ